MKKMMIAVLSVFIFLYGCSEEAVIMESHKSMSNIQLIDALKKADKEYTKERSESVEGLREHPVVYKDRKSLIHEIDKRNLFKDMSIQQVQDIFYKLTENCTEKLYQPYEGSVCEYSTIFEYGAIFIYTDKSGKVIGSKTFNY